MQTDEIRKKRNRSKEDRNDKKRKVKNSRKRTKSGSYNRERKIQNLGFDEERKV